MALPELPSFLANLKVWQSLSILSFMVITVVHVINHLLALLFNKIKKKLKSKTTNSQQELSFTQKDSLAKTNAPTKFFSSPADAKNIHDTSDPMFFQNREEESKLKRRGNNFPNYHGQRM